MKKYIKKNSEGTDPNTTAFKLFEFIQKKKSYVTVLSCLVVFITTYLLILPAITLDKDEADKQGGIDIQTQQEQLEDIPVKDPDADTNAKASDPDKIILKTEPDVESGDITYKGKGYEVSANCDKAGLPEGTELVAEEINKSDESYNGLYEDALKAVQKDGDNKVSDFAFAKFYDISLLSDGEAIEPDNPIDVTISYEKALKASDADHIRIVHFAVDEETGEVETEVLDPDTVDAKIKSGKMQETTFAAESFSVYAIVYTVDFHYEVNGKKYEFSIPGGGCVTLSQMADTLGINEQSSEEGNEEKGFALENVEDVEFSNPDLIWVGKADEETTVGALKETNELECQYSEELTEEDIAEIDAHTVEAGDWALISLQPFDTEETLTVTMENGDQFVVNVTDAMYGITPASNLNGTTGALVNTARNNVVQSAAHSESGRLQAEGVSIDTSAGTISTTNSSAVITEWTFTRVGDSGNNYYIRSDAGYLNINGSNVTVSQNPQALRVDTNSNNQIRIISGNYALNNWGSNTANGYAAYNNLGYTTNPDEWFTVYELEPAHVTVHYVDRNGNPIQGVAYSGTNPLVTQKEDGTFTIPYNWSGKTSETEVDLRAEFSKQGYTYANTHLAGKDASGDELKHDGYIIDSTLSSSNGDLLIHTDTGETNFNWMTEDPNVVLGNLAYGELKTYSLSGRIYTRPTDNTGNKLPYVLSNNKDIYVVLDPVPTNTSAGSGSVDPGDVAEPSLDKTMVSNNDGTYTLSLKVDAHAASASDTNKANVLFVVDTSSSMRKTTTAGRTRIMDTHDSVLDLGERLLKYNEFHPGAVEVSMITFDGGVDERLDWTTDTSAFQDAVNTYLKYYYLHTGTDWEDALQGALDKYLYDKNDNKPTDDDPTFVIFFTDGEPSQYTNFHGAGENTNTDVPDPITGGTAHESVSGGYPDFYSYFLSREGAKDEMRAIVDAGIQLYGIYAYNTTNDAYDGYNGPEDGAKMLHNAIKYGYNTSDDLTNNLFYEAKNTNDLKGAFDKIFNLITEKVGFSNVVVKDGIASEVTSTTVVDGDVSGFTYTIRNKAGALAYKVTVAPNGVPDGQTITDGTPLFWLSEDGPPHVGRIKPITTTRVKTDDDGNPIKVDGKIQTENVDINAYYCEIDGNEYIMPIATTGRSVTWDLSPLGVLKDGYSYEVDFIVWPNQGSYDIVADLNNGKRPDLEETADWDSKPILKDQDGNEYKIGGFEAYPYIARYEETGIYSAMSNTNQSVDYYKVDQRIENGNEVTVYTGPNPTPIDPPGPMPLTASASQIEKQWNVERDPIVFAQYLYEADGTSKEFKIDFDIFQGNSNTPYLTTSLGWDSEKEEYVWPSDSPIVEVDYAGGKQIGTRWSQDFAIATGLMLSEARMEELGLNKSLYPSGTYNGITYYILEEGHDYRIEEKQTGTIGYEFDFTPPVYHPMLVDNVLQSVIFTKTGAKTVDITEMKGAPGGLSSLLIENTLRGYLHLKKVVVGKDGNRIPSDKTKFEYTIKLDNAAVNTATNQGLFVGDHIPWYGINGLFYHDEDFNYYHVYKDTDDNNNAVWRLKDEQGGVYLVTSTGFDPDLAGEQSVTYDKGGESETVKLFGNVTTPSNNGKHVEAKLEINQDETLSIANVPVGTTYSITESEKDGYNLVDILREIKAGDTVESQQKIKNVSERTIKGTIVENRDNDITFKNKLNPGALKFKKVVQVDYKTPTEEQYQSVDGEYIFTVTNAEGNDFAFEKYVQITVSNGSATSFKIADTEEGLDSAQTKPVEDGWVVLRDLAQGDYVITETEERNGLLLTDIVRGDESSEVVDFDNGNVTVHVTKEDENATNTNAQATFTNNFFNNDGPDRITIDIEKTFEGLASEEDIPDNFQVVISYTAGGSTTPFELTLKKNQDETVEVGREHIKIKETTDGYKLSWHITNLPKDADNFKIKEVNYDSVAGYTFTSAALDGASITETAGQWHNMSVTAPHATLSDVTGQRRTPDSVHNLKFILEDNDILLSKLTSSMGTMVITKKSLNTLEREAIKNGTGWPQQGGFSKEKITFFSLEEHPNGFKYGGKTVTFGEENGKTTVSFSHNASAQEYVYVVTYGTQTYLNNAALTNTYTQTPLTLELIKVDADNTETPLEHAQFTLKELDPNDTGNYLTGDEALEKTSNETGADGKATITGIPNGYYEISENKVPTGYILEGDGKFYIRVARGTITRIIKMEDDPDTENVNEGLVKNWPTTNEDSGNIWFVGTRPATDTSEAVTTYKVGNTLGAELPSSGGPGTTWIYLIGSLLLLGSGIALVSRRRIQKN